MIFSKTKMLATATQSSTWFENYGKYGSSSPFTNVLSNDYVKIIRYRIG